MRPFTTLTDLAGDWRNDWECECAEDNMLVKASAG
jgi:hypothetical protein